MKVSVALRKEPSSGASRPASNAVPTAYLLCDRSRTLTRVSLASLASEDGNTALIVVLGTGSDMLAALSTVPAKPSVNSGMIVNCQPSTL